MFCNISNLFIILFISVPKVRIFGDRDIFVKSSSTVQLKCVVSQSLVAPTYMEWRHNTQRIPIATTVGSQSSGLVVLLISKTEINCKCFIISRHFVLLSNIGLIVDWRLLVEGDFKRPHQNILPKGLLWARLPSRMLKIQTLARTHVSHRNWRQLT